MITFPFLSSRYLNAIQTMCPHILRYLTTAVITNKDVRKRRQVLKDLVKVIQQVMSTSCSIMTSWPSADPWIIFLFSLPQESYTYKDPITEFVECLYVNFDFDSAQKKLRECESVRRASLSFLLCAWQCVFVTVHRHKSPQKLSASWDWGVMWSFS